jgi:hypothetical protein
MYSENESKGKKIVIENKVNCCGCNGGHDDNDSGSAYGYFYLLFPTALNIAAGADIPLNNADTLNNISFTAPMAIIGRSGDYLINYGVNLGSTQESATQIAIAVNGSPVASTLINIRAAGSGEFSGNAILKLNKNDSVTIRNVPGGNSITLAASPSVGAQMTISFLGNS